ncbi:hypothetical protein Avbf_00972 [Armadillidium vulgare]|nr:hypothetical protein Avbf_00972 [Armadillidium vulgare]
MIFNRLNVLTIHVLTKNLVAASLKIRYHQQPPRHLLRTVLL